MSATRTTRVALGVVVLGLTTAVLPAAQASGPPSITGGCALKAVQLADTTTFNGAVTESSTTQDHDGVPIGATVKCGILVNGVVVTPWYEFPGSNGVQSGSQTTTFDAAISDAIFLCKQVVFADGTITPYECASAQIIGVPGAWLAIAKS